MLMHVTPREVSSMQALAQRHGKSLTVNPKTGMPEAGILDSILPLVAGIGLNAAFPGLGALGAGLLGGGVTALLTGNLQKGLMAGLGAYGGAGLGSALAGMGEAAAGQAVQTLASPALGVEEMTGAIPNSFGGTPEMIASEMGSISPTLPGDLYSTNFPGIQQAGAQASAAKAAQLAAMTPYDKMAGGVQQLGSGQGWKTLYDTAKYPMLAVAGSVGPSLMSQQQAAPQQRGSGPVSYYKTEFNPGEVNPKFGQPGETYFTGRGFGPGEFSPTYPYADGGVIPMANGGYPQANISRANYANSVQDPKSAEVVDGYGPKIDPFTGEERMAGGGIATLTYAAGGQLLRGPGDGVSDSIPAVIDGPQPQRAALADGEFVLPARAVSEIGNGSTEAGARKLYAMLDRIQKGRKKSLKDIAADTRAERHLPA